MVQTSTSLTAREKEREREKEMERERASKRAREREIDSEIESERERKREREREACLIATRVIDVDSNASGRRYAAAPREEGGDAAHFRHLQEVRPLPSEEGTT